MCLKKIKFIFIAILLYQIPFASKSNSFENFSSRNFSKYFSGIVAFENKNNLEALDFFNSSKVLINKHEPYLKRYIFSLVLNNKVPSAINIIKQNKGKKNSDFFEAQLLLTLDNLKKKNFDEAKKNLLRISSFSHQDRFDEAIIETLREYIYVFKDKKIPTNKKSYGKLSFISETFQRCYLGDKATDTFFTKLFNDPQSDYSRYIFFYLSYLIENDRVNEARELANEIEYIKSPLLLSQGKNWIESNYSKKISEVFSCSNHNDIIGEFFFLISNIYSAEDDFKKSNFYLNLANFLNPKFIFNLSLVVENQFFNGEYEKARETLKNFKKEDNFYFWYRVKKEAKIIAKLRNKRESLNYITAEFDKILKPNKKFIFDIAGFYKNSEEYEQAIEYYTKLLNIFDAESEIKSDILYRRGGCYERLGKYKKADEDLINSLKINPDDAYVLNYLAYSWLERDYKINDAIEMLETAYAIETNDPYIIDSIGWAYYLIDDFLKAEKLLKRAVELMPDDPIVNDHYGDILWRLDRKIQARYFWTNVINMDEVENDMLEKINLKLIDGLEKL